MAAPPGRTRFAPAPTGYLHLGHAASAIFVWGMARAAGGSVLLRIEDHDRLRTRPGYDAAILEDLAWLGFAPDAGPVRQSEDGTPYSAAAAGLQDEGLVYGCDCSRTTFERWAAERGKAWRGPGCPGACRQRAIDGPTLRVALGGGSESWMDALVGPCTDAVASHGDPPIRAREGNWTYFFSVVVDDLRQEIDLVVRGRDLLGATAAQIRLGRLLGRARPASFAHHPLVRRPDGRKLSKADSDTSVRDLRASGRAADELIGESAAAVGLIRTRRPIAADQVMRLFHTDP
ncbi:MAG: tRNA glutamyl-Q(34) synthetase GluQRS [Thermomicrobiales bacterium]|jgi:glutamyl-Q tRNA(Asp) synthetase|nr:MAG: tRNA glutamyl-Q(34) synthetase GluQRS [Thermomicrobiales bacterium]